MLGIVIFLTVLSIIALPINGTSRDRRLDAVVQLLQNQLNNERGTSSDSSSDDDKTQSVVGQNFNTIDVINLIKQAQAKASNKVQNRFHVQDRQKFRDASYSLKKYIQDFQQKTNSDVEENNKIKNRVVEQILIDERKPLKKKRLTPNRLISPSQYVYENEDRGGKSSEGLSQYSKIFIILDPIALKNSRNMNDVQNLLSEILMKSSSAVEKSRYNRAESKHNYKGFLIKDNAKSRRYRESGDNDDDDYKPKRGRNDHGGGGGGRTAIPYIRHRGDIYEKEH